MRCMCVYWHCIATQCAAIAEERNPLCCKQVGKAVHYLEIKDCSLYISTECTIAVTCDCTLHAMKHTPQAC